MELRTLGTTGLKVSPLAFGGNVFGWTADEATSFALLDRYVDAGFNFIDTADIYSRWVPGHQGGESETIIGKWLLHSGKRDQVVISTKVGMDVNDRNQGLTASQIRMAIEGSLTRLKTDVIDLYFSHQDDKNTPLIETLETYRELIQEGKIRSIGASNYSAEGLTEALKVSETESLPAYSVLQPLYNLSDRKVFEAGLKGVCEAAGIGVVPYYSLAAGFLTGKYRSEKDLENKARGGTVKPYLTDRGQRILKALDEAASRLNAVPAQVALAWLMVQPTVTAPIVSATSIEQLDQVLKSAELKLDAETLKSLNEASAE